MAAVVLISALSMACLSAAWAQNATEPLAPLDGLEHRFELGQHERLVKTRKSKGAKLASFASDGCSGGLSAGWRLIASTLPAIAARYGDRPPWESCCIAHDRAYHIGAGPDADAETSFDARRLADEELRQCVMRVGEERMPALTAEYGLRYDEVSQLHRRIADIMHGAVRLGGVPCTGLPWRWGFGWPHCE
jgi:hypothetical protein